MNSRSAIESEPTALREGLRPLMPVAAALGLLFALAVSLQLHGFSLGLWHSVIDGSPPDEILLGTPRYIRADDWLVQLPMSIAQSAHDPAFPVVNSKIGTGQDMSLPIEVPIASPTLLVRPGFWGFLIDVDVGVAWLWWVQVMGIFGGWLLVFYAIAHRRRGIAVAAALVLSVAPYFPLWSFTKATIPAAMALCLAATFGIASAKNRSALVFLSVVLGWSGAVFACNVYPPNQVPLAFLFLLSVGAWLYDPVRRPTWQSQWPLRVAAVFGAGLIALVLTGYFIWEASDAIAAIQQTVYPGARVSTGGDAPWSWLFTAHTAAPLFVRNWGALQNICGGTGFWITFPCVVIAMAWARVRDPLAMMLAAFCVALTLYRIVGVPEIVARFTLLSYLPADRTTMAIGLADAMLLVRWLAIAGEYRSPGRPLALMIAIAWGAVVVGSGFLLQGVLPELPTAAVLGGGVLAVGFGFLIVIGWHPKVLLCAIAGCLLPMTLWFNPLAQGGVDYIRNNDVSREIVAIDRAMNGESRWVTYGNSDLANLPRMLGVASVGGVVSLPELDLWKRLDPQQAATSIYNRYAHVSLRPTPRAEDPLQFRLSSPHGIVLYVSPETEDLQKLGVTHLLVRVTRRSEAYWSEFEPVAAPAKRTLLFELPLVRRMN